MIYTVIFFFNDTATTEIYTLSLHDALPISRRGSAAGPPSRGGGAAGAGLRVCRLGRVRGERASFPALARARRGGVRSGRSEEHTSELQSQSNLVCRLLLEKKTRATATARAN